MKRLLTIGLSVFFIATMLAIRSGGGVAHAVSYERFCDYSGSGKCLDAAGGGGGFYGQEVQLYTEGKTSGEWHVLNIATVTGPGEWPFTPGDGFNTFYDGDQAMEMEYAPNGVASGFCYSPSQSYNELIDCTANGENYNTNALLVEHGSSQQYLVDVLDTDSMGTSQAQFEGSLVLWANGNTNTNIPTTKLGQIGNNWEEWSQP